jgi:cytoskeletal protein CcmA (bactofilin family)
MFSHSSEETVIAEGLKIEGTVTADGLVRVHGKVIGDLRCTSLIISEGAEITGTVTADTVEVDGFIEGPIRCADVVLKSKAHVTGDIHHTSLAIEKGAIFIGRSKQSQAASKKKKTPVRKSDAKKPLAAANDDAPAKQSEGVA